MVNDPIETKVEIDEEEYNVSIVWSKAIQQGDPEQSTFLSILFRLMMSQVSF